MIQGSDVMEQKLANDYWFTKLSGEDVPKLSHAIKNIDAERQFVQLAIKSSTIEYIQKVSRGNLSTQYIAYISFFNILLSTYFRSTTNIIVTVGPENLAVPAELSKFVFYKIFATGEKNLKDYLRDVSQEFQEVQKYKEYDLLKLTNKLSDFGFDIESFTHFGFSFSESKILDSKIKFQLYIEQQEDGEYVAGISFLTSLYNIELVKQFLHHYLNLLDRFEESIDKQVSDLDILSPEEVNKQLNLLNATLKPYPSDKTVIDLFEDQVVITPNNIAVDCGGKRITYLELNTRSNQLAHYLRRKLKLSANDLVGVLLPKSENLVISILAILKTGAAYVPIDPTYPGDRIKLMVGNSELKAVIRDDINCSDAIDTLSINLSQNCDGLMSESQFNLQRRNSKQDLIYVIYTSGSTAIPKGAMVKHSSFTNLVCWYSRVLAVEENDRFLLLAPISFDLAQKNIFTPLSKGASIYLSEKVQGDYFHLAKVIEEEKINIINLAPSAFYPLLDPFTNNNYQKLQSITKVVLGGEPINIKAILPWTKSAFYHAEVINSYGPTECTDVVSSFSIPNASWETIEVIPIGYPIDNLKLFVLDSNQRFLPFGVPGEIYIGGTGLGAGYLKDEIYTREKFVKSLFDENEYLYRTGDLGKWNLHGQIEFIGRDDKQIKIRGYRIDVIEVEEAMKSLDSIENSVVIALDNERDNSKLLAGYFMSNSPVEISELREHLARLLPSHMIPSYFIQLKSFPQTPSGKIDRKSLPHPQLNTSEKNPADRRYIAPSNPIQKNLVRIWEEVLGVTSPGIRDNFFELGGHSLKAIHFLGKIHKEFGVRINLKNIFLNATIENIAELIANDLWFNSSSEEEADSYDEIRL